MPIEYKKSPYKDMPNLWPKFDDFLRIVAMHAYTPNYEPIVSAKKPEDVKQPELDKLKKAISLESNFVNDLGMDSLDTVELIMDCEETFGIEITDEDAERINTLNDAILYILTKHQSELGRVGTTTKK